MGIIGCLTNKKVLAYIGGIATATLGVKILKSGPVHRAAVRTAAESMKLRDSAMNAFETIKEDAQDLYHEARQQSGEKEEPEADE